MQESHWDAVTSAINKECRKYLSNPENLENSASSIVDDLIDDAIMSVVFEVDILRKSGLTDVLDGESDTDSYQIVDVPGLDIFGQAVYEKNNQCACPCCNRTLAASKFAPHLSKCMGMGRNSSRIARNRIANNANKEVGGGTSSGAISDDDDDDDWTVMTEKKGKKKKDKVTGKKQKSLKSLKNGNSVSDGSNSSSGSASNVSYESMSEKDRRVLFTTICGVVSDHTKKVCTKSAKCPLHTEEQKKAVRDLYLTDVDSCLENFQIDVDTFEEEGDLAKESLVRSWEAEHSNTSSPADSASTSSSSSKKREKPSFKIKIKD